jgi:DNA repair protein RecO (recombination protein O)
MSEAINVTGMVISAMPIGENDKRLVLLTREEGKIVAFARGARRPKSSLLAVSNPFVMGIFSVIPGKNAYSLVQASVKEYFTELAQEIPGIYYGFYFLELTGYYTEEGMDATEVLNLLYFSLKALQNPKLEDRLIRRTFEIRLMTINGDYAPTEDLSPQALYAIRYMMTANLTRVFQFQIENNALSEIEKHTNRCLERIVDRRIRSLEILEQFL